jgi:putative transposase
LQNFSRVDVLMAQGRQVADAVRTIGVTEVAYNRRRHGVHEYGEDEEQPSRQAVSDLTLDKLDPGRGRKGKPARRGACVDHATAELSISKKGACRSLIEKEPHNLMMRQALTASIIKYRRHKSEISLMAHAAVSILRGLRDQSFAQACGSRSSYKVK